jgi:DNA polymerase-4
MPLFDALKLCPNAQLVAGNSEKYLTTGLRLVEIFKCYTDLVEPYSIDESFLDISRTERFFGGAENIARRIKSDILKKFGITCSVGVGPNKLVAKMASDWEKPDGLVVVRPEELPERLWSLPVEEIPGVGPKNKVKLKLLGIRTISDLAHCSLPVLRQRFGIIGEYLYNCAWSFDDSPVDPGSVSTQPKSISSATTLTRNIDDFSLTRAVLLSLASRVGRRLRKSGLAALIIFAGVRYADLSFEFHQTGLDFPTDSTKCIFQTALKLLRKLEPFKMPVRLVGIGVDRIQPKDLDQLVLFACHSSDCLDLVSDKINDRYGEETIFAARTLLGRDLIHF